MQVADVSSCAGCPLYGDGTQQFVFDTDQPRARLHVKVDHPTERDPLVGLEKSLALAGITISEVSASRAVRCTVNLPAPVTTVQFNNGKRGPLENGVRFCNQAHGTERAPAPLVVTQGDLALYALTGQRSSHEWRGWGLPYLPMGSDWLDRVWTPGQKESMVLAMVSSADMQAMPILQYVARQDWKKAGRALRREWPKEWPGYSDKPPKAWPRLSAFDTEFDPATGILERYSLYTGKGQPWVVEAHNVQELGLIDAVTVVMHNIEADIVHLQRFLRGGAIKTEDTMLMHAVLWSDLSHSLEFLGSVFATINRWKHLFHRNPKVYSGGDAVGTWDVYLALVREMQADLQSAWIYRNSVFPLTPVIMEAESVGLRLDQGHVQSALVHHKALQREVELEAQAYCGFPINLGSSEQVARWLYQVEKVGRKIHGRSKRAAKGKD